jgi:hypothetical protein
LHSKARSRFSEGGIGENRLWPVFALGLMAGGSSGGAARPKTLTAFCRTWVLSTRSSSTKKGPVKGPVFMAERVGFEPTVPLRVRRISSAVLSTTQPPLRRGRTSPRRAVREVETARNVNATRAPHKTGSADRISEYAAGFYRGISGAFRPPRRAEAPRPLTLAMTAVRALALFGKVLPPAVKRHRRMLDGRKAVRKP